MSSLIATNPVRFRLYSHGIIILPILFKTMLIAYAILFVVPNLVASSGEGNINLMKDEVATALRSCSYNNSTDAERRSNNRESRSYVYEQSQLGKYVPRIDNNMKQDIMNLYNHDRRNSTNQIYVLNGTKNYTVAYDGQSNTKIKYARPTTLPSEKLNNFTTNNWIRRKRNVSLVKYSDQKQCLSQCVFANLQVVDVRGIPREAELWNKMQTSLTSQHSRNTLLRDQVRACFQELATEDEDNGCSYSNKLERCLMLRFSDRQSKKTL